MRAPYHRAADSELLRMPLKVVLLGDSYSAGNGARDASGDPDVYGPRGCNRSRSNWAEQYLDHLRTGGYAITFLNRACSGGVMDDLNNQRELDPKVGRTEVPGIWAVDVPELEARSSPTL